MRTTWRSACVLATVTVLLWATPTASQPLRRLSPPRTEPDRHTQTQEREQSPSYQADCRTVVDGSQVTAYCHNPYPDTDRVRLHVECDRWWDVDADTAAVQVGPAGYVELTQRCWKEIRAVWVSHQPLRDGAGT
ncbi:hypothetical protein [Streptomyces sp. NPDC002889]|uniref:hypothetical protein n=1 Tax=Streptomyces sp. NPDC002889 TaxID=3364669 RepID=UPI0036C3C068